MMTVKSTVTNLAGELLAENVDGTVAVPVAQAIAAAIGENVFLLSNVGGVRCEHTVRPDSSLENGWEGAECGGR